ncbi:MAG: protein kinase [Gammaproteobacteria bacterium]|nr:protein kinase [Gammaproteobacteria bacterium]
MQFPIYRSRSFAAMGDRGGGRILEEQEWYHGMLPRKEISEHLRNKGDWLVRCTEKNGEPKIVISVGEGHNAGPRHVMLKKDKTGYRMPNMVFQTVVELVEYYKRTKKPLNNNNLCLSGNFIKRRKWMIPNKDVRLEKKVGEGAFGEVFVGTLKLAKREIPIAAKTCKQVMSTDERDEFLQEAKLMLMYRHRNVARIFGVAADKPPIMLIMERCDGGALDSYLKKKANITMSDKVRFCLEAAAGMDYLVTKKNCVHRDLAARNCLIGQRKDKQGNVTEEMLKISDFGLSKTGSHQLQDQDMKNARLPIKWAAPESLESGTFTHDSDMWTFGVLL